MKISEITPEIVKDYCGISDDYSDRIITDVLIPAAKSYIVGYTGLPAENLDNYEDFTTALLVLVNDMYTNREYTLNYCKQVNPAVKTILGLYSVNYL